MHDQLSAQAWRSGVAAAFAAAALAVAAGPSAWAAEPSADCALKDGETRTVIRVIDGETLELNGGIEVRLVGALAPRSSDAGVDVAEWPWAIRARAELEALAGGQGVELGFSGRRSDRYGRLLAHVFVKSGGAQTWVQGEMLKRGLARAYGIEGSAACLAELIAHEAIARETAAGLWSDPAYVVRGAEEIDQLAEARGTFQVVEGKVRAASEIRGTLYVNFGEDVRQDFTVTVRGEMRKRLAALGIEPVQLEGQRIRVRGWIERRGGPMIALDHPGAIEVLAEPAEAAAPTPAPRRSRSRKAAVRSEAQ